MWWPLQTLYKIRTIKISLWMREETTPLLENFLTPNLSQWREKITFLLRKVATRRLIMPPWMAPHSAKGENAYWIRWAKWIFFMCEMNLETICLGEIGKFGRRKSVMDMVKINCTQVWNFHKEYYLKHLPSCSHNKCLVPVSCVLCQTLILTLWSLWFINWWWSGVLHFSQKSFLILFNQAEL